MSDWHKTLLRDDSLISDAVKVLERVSLRIVLIVNSDGGLVGTVTDGDVRRGLMNNASMDDQVKSIMNENPVTASFNQSKESILALM